jgi:hypothetical protein
LKGEAENLLGLYCGREYGNCYVVSVKEVTGVG